jgi:hypothetical protein
MKFGYKRGIYLQPIIKIVIKFVKILGMDNNIILTLRLV